MFSHWEQNGLKIAEFLTTVLSTSVATYFLLFDGYYYCGDNSISNYERSWTKSEIDVNKTRGEFWKSPNNYQIKVSMNPFVLEVGVVTPCNEVLLEFYRVFFSFYIVWIIWMYLSRDWMSLGKVRMIFIQQLWSLYEFQ